MKPIRKKDWKMLRSMKEEKLNHACEQILEAVGAVIASKGSANHKAYLEVFEKIHSGDSEIAAMFDDLRRSNAVIKLAAWRRYGLLTESELNEFSAETQAGIKAITGK
jgi:hypothetical protein